MVGILRALSFASAPAAAVITAAALSSSSSSSSSSPPSSSAATPHPLSSSRFPVNPSNLFAPSPLSASATKSFDAVKPPSKSRLSAAAAALHMDSPATELKFSADQNGSLPELMTEFMVDMKCEGCVTSVKNNLLKLDGIKSVDVDLTNQVVRVLGSVPVKTMTDALLQTGRNARLIGQGNPNDFLVSAAVAEFKGPVIYGVVRLAQVNMELARIEASFSGLSPGNHGWAINEFGDLTRGVASTGKVYNPPNHSSEKALGDLGTLEALENGETLFSGSKEMIRVADLIGRSIAVYETDDKSDQGIAAAVIARSAGVGENYKKICTCDGVTIWESN